MAIVNVNMGEIKERQPLAAPGPYTFSFRKAELRPTKDGSGYLIYAELTPEGHGTDTIIHRWSLKPGALESRAPSISLKKFFEVMGRADLATASDGFDTDELLPLRFSGRVKHEEYNGETQVRLDAILGPVD